MKKTVTINFVDGVIEKSEKLQAEEPRFNNMCYYSNWRFESRRNKIVCTYEDQNHKIKYQVFGNGYFKLSEKNSQGNWITIKDGLLRKSKNKFSGYITLPTELDIRKIRCFLK